MTATERQYRGNSDDILSMDDVSVYGDAFDQLSFKAALVRIPTKPDTKSDRSRTVIRAIADSERHPSTGSTGHAAASVSSLPRLTVLFLGSRMLSPARLRRCALWTRRSRMASATVGLAIISCQLGTYAQSIAAPILSEVNVTDVTHDGVEFRVCTSVGEWRSGGVVVATGACDTPYRPSMAGNLASCIHQINPSDYREPTQLPTGGVLVVGASATGAQLAEEIHASGRPVTLSVGAHPRAAKIPGQSYVRMDGDHRHSR